MMKLLIGGSAAAITVAMTPAIAQPAPPPPPGVASGTAQAMPAMPAMPRIHTMMMTGRTMTREEVAAHVRTLFAKLDTNRDGFITHEEMDAVHQKMMGMHAEMQQRFGDHRIPRPDRAAMFDRLDSNHDGSISRQEYMAAQPQIREKRMMVMENGPDGPGRMTMPHMPGMMMPGMMMHSMGMGGMGGHLFEMADANHDGRVSLAEAEAAALARFDRADLNHDGKITPGERLQAHQLMRQRRPS